MLQAAAIRPGRIGCFEQLRARGRHEPAKTCLRLSVMRHLVSAMFVVVAVIHLLPLSGVLGAGHLATLYGIAFDDPNAAILMRHRAVLLGLLGLFLLLAAFRREWQGFAFVAGFASVVPFLVLAWTVGGYNAQVGRVVTADVVALVCLVIGVAAWSRVRRERFG
jgi:hypothetical protein